MLIWKILLSFTLIWALGAKEGSSYTPRECNEGIVMPDFDPKKFSGDWWYNQRTPEIEFQSWTCVQYIFYPPKDNDDFPVVRYWIDANDKTANVLIKNAKLNETGQGASLGGYSQTVIGADEDYENFAIISSCKQEENRRVVWIFTRSPDTIDEDTMKEIEIVLRKNGIGNDELVKVDNDNCPQSWAGAKISEEGLSYDDVKEELNEHGLYMDE